MRLALTEHVRIRALGLERNEGFSLHFKENFLHCCLSKFLRWHKRKTRQRWRDGNQEVRLVSVTLGRSSFAVNIPKFIWRQLHASYSEVVSPKHLNTATLMLPKQTLLISKTRHGNTVSANGVSSRAGLSLWPANVRIVWKPVWKSWKFYSLVMLVLQKCLLTALQSYPQSFRLFRWIIWLTELYKKILN